MKEPVDHILRQSLPWRPQAEAITECGHSPHDVRSITREQFNQREKDLGKQRAAMLTCMTCADSMRRWSHTGGSGNDIRSVLGREIEWERGGAYWHIREDRGYRLKDELTAIALLIEAHREEFAAHITAIEQRRGWLEKKSKMQQNKRPQSSVL